MNQPDHRDMFRLEGAAKYLGWTEDQVLLAVAQNVLRVGVMGRGWVARAHPTGDEWPQLGWGGGHCDDVPNQKLKVYLFDHPSGKTYKVQEFTVVQFWYLHHSDAYELINIKPQDMDIRAVEPYDGADLHRSFPNAYPWPEFFAFISQKQENRRITKSDLLFLRRDLDNLVGATSFAHDLGRTADESPNLRGKAVGADERAGAHRAQNCEPPQRRLIAYKKLERVGRDDWPDAFYAAIRIFEGKNGFTANARELWLELGSNPPKNFKINRDDQELYMPGSPPLTWKRFYSRFRRLYPDDVPV